MAKNSYKWNYCSVGGVTRVKIDSGKDIEHLGELDQKMWTALSCPVKGLEFDAKTLAFLDADGDGVIKVYEVLAASKYLVAALKDSGLILKGSDSIKLSDFSDSETGRSLAASAAAVLRNLGKEQDSISIADVSDYSACKAQVEIDKDAVFPYGDNTAAALAAYEAVAAKVADYFTRCKLLVYDAAVAASTSVAITDIADIASCPISLPREDGILPYGAVNPAWQGAFSAVRNLILDIDFKGAESITEDQWNGIAGKFSAYKSWRDDKSRFEVDPSVVEIDRFLHLYRDFYRFLNNYVIFNDFYSRDPETRAVFEAGNLYIDQRCCNLCVRVSDMSKHSDMAGLSGMFLIYCKCTSKSGAVMDIVAVMTNGSTESIRVGKNAIFYDRGGESWDAVVTKIVDNPVNIKSAFFRPYIKFWEFCKGILTKSAAEKDAKMNADLQKTVTEPKKAPFDIAKFAGIFAAIGMAVGFIGQAVVAVVSGIASLSLFQFIVVLVLLMLVISTPSCFLAWDKLRKRNLGPVLNANGWAINSVILVNILFGATLTSVAKYPHLNLPDPYKKKVPVWKKLLSWTVFALIVAFVVLYFTNNLGCIGLEYHKGAIIGEINEFGAGLSSAVQQAAEAGKAAADSVSVAQ